MAITAVVNRPHPNRVQVRLGSDISGPLFSITLGMFDPRRDLDVYNGGRPMTVSSYTWDPVRNRYLLFLEEELDFDYPVQVIHHVPNPAFLEYDENPDLHQLSLGQNPEILADPAVGV